LAKKAVKILIGDGKWQNVTDRIPLNSAKRYAPCPMRYFLRKSLS
jgi:hypothetical protein